jgi:hypothetical protein
MSSLYVTVIVVSCISLCDRRAFGILRFITADYFHATVCFLWDFIMFSIWCGCLRLFSQPIQLATRRAE